MQFGQPWCILKRKGGCVDKQEPSGAVELGRGIYWVGTLEERRGLDCNPYLIIDGDKAVLVDPGSVIDFEVVLANVTAFLPVEKIDYIILHHQDPDLCSSMPLFEKAGFRGKVVTHWRTSLLVQYYGIQSSYSLVNQESFKLELTPSRTLQFIPAPYMHFPGAIMTYDPVEQILFSGDVFGAYTYKRKLWADESYLDVMKLFHENYMPSNDVIRPVMEKLLTLPIRMIAPQHGSIINGEKEVNDHIKVLRDLECGAFLTPTRKELVQAGNYTGLCNQVLKRLLAIFPGEEVSRIFEGTGIILDPGTRLIQDYQIPGKQLWNDLFRLIYAKQGIKWLTVVESLVEKLTSQYDVEIPETLKSVLYSSEKQLRQMDETNRKLQQEAVDMKTKLGQVQDQLMRCPVTNLYNERFFFQFLQARVEEKDKPFGLIFISLDNIASINSQYGKQAGDEVMRGVSYLIRNYINEKRRRSSYLAVKLNAPLFALFVPTADPAAVRETAENLRQAVEEADIFIEPVTISLGTILSNETILSDIGDKNPVTALMERGTARANHAKTEGGNSICDFPILKKEAQSRGTVVLIEPDELIREMITGNLTDRNIRVFPASTGPEGMKLIEQKNPNVIICELNTPQMDGLTLKRNLGSSTQLQNIPFILLTSQKTEQAIEQAVTLNIRHFFSKPFSLVEISGLAANLLERR